MATLNTLRTKGGVVLAVVIGVSLLAFLLGDLATSGGTLFNSSRMNVGEINGSKISYNDYLNRIDQLTMVQQIATGSESLNEQQQNTVRENAWEQIARECSFNASLDNLGLLVSDEEAIDMVDGEFISPVLNQLFTDRETGSFDQNAVRQYVTTLDSDGSGRKRAFWNYLEKEMIEERAMNKFIALTKNAVIANNIDVENAVSSANNFFDIVYTGKSFASIADSLVKVTDADYKKYYDEHSRLFKRVDSREIEYVVFESLPSAVDYKDAENTITTMAAEFAATQDAEQYVSMNSSSKFDPAYYSVSELPVSLKEFAFNTTDGSVFAPQLEGDVYTMARVLDVKELADTVGLRHIILAPGQEKLADSLKNEIMKDKASFGALVTLFSLDKQTPGGDIGRVSANQFVGFGDFYDKINNAKQGDVFVANSPYGIHVMEETYRGPAVKKAKLAVVKYKVEPSDKTIHDAFTKATDFVAASKGKGGDFEKAVETSGVSKRVARLKAGDTSVSGINQSREIVRWAFGAEKEDISDVISIGEANIVVKVSGAEEHGITPLKQVKKDILPEIIRQKKIEMLAAEFSGSSVEDCASKLGVEVKTADSLNFASFFIPELGVAQKVIGLASVLPQGAMSKPVDAGTEVVVFSVPTRGTIEETNFETQKVVTQTTMEGDVFGRVYSAVFNMADIKDSRIKFF